MQMSLLWLQSLIAIVHVVGNERNSITVRIQSDSWSCQFTLALNPDSSEVRNEATRGDTQLELLSSMMLL